MRISSPVIEPLSTVVVFGGLVTSQDPYINGVGVYGVAGSNGG